MDFIRHIRFTEALLSPLQADNSSPSDVDSLLGRLLASRSIEVGQALQRHQLEELWFERIRELGLEPLLPEELAIRLERIRRRAILREIVQRQTAIEVTESLEQAGIPSLVFKGAHLRAAIYSEPWLRPACDVDVLVEPGRYRAALQVLARRGFPAHHRQPKSDHETTVTRSGQHVDIHGRLLRPGRTRWDPTEVTVQSRVRQGRLWVPDDVAATVILLVHPALTEYLTARLVHAVDLDSWLRSGRVDWRPVLERVAHMGLLTAGWITLEWTRRWFHTPAPASALREMAPGRMHQRYLNAWVRLDPYWVHARAPNLARAGFSLALHDRVSDAAKAVIALWRPRRRP